MWHAIPVKDLLLLLCSDTVVLVHKVEEWALRFLERCIGARLKVAQIREDALLELFGILNWASEGLKPEGETSYDIRTGDVKQVVPAKYQDRLTDDRLYDLRSYHKTHETYSPVGKRNLLIY